MRRLPALKVHISLLRIVAAASLALLLLAEGCHRKGAPKVAAPNTAKYADALSPMIAAKKTRFPALALDPGLPGPARRLLQQPPA